MTDAADASDHEAAAKAIRDGLIQGHSKGKPGYWLHTGGTGILTYADSDAERLGEWSDEEYNDWSGVSELTSLPDHAFHRNVDKLVLRAAEENGDVLRTAIVAPPTIYGKGRGPASTRGRQTYEMAKLILDKKFIPVVGAGKTRWNHTHVADVSQVFLLLVEAAAKHDDNPEMWNDKGYYLVEQGEHVWADLARLMGAKAVEQKLLSSVEEKSLGKDAAMDVAGFEALSWGLNSRGKALRAGKLLDWSPKERSLESEVPTMLESEYKLLQTS